MAVKNNICQILDLMRVVSLLLLTLPITMGKTHREDIFQNHKNCEFSSIFIFNKHKKALYNLFRQTGNKKRNS